MSVPNVRHRRQGRGDEREVPRLKAEGKSEELAVLLDELLLGLLEQILQFPQGRDRAEIKLFAISVFAIVLQIAFRYPAIDLTDGNARRVNPAGINRDYMITDVWLDKNPGEILPAFDGGRESV